MRKLRRMIVLVLSVCILFGGTMLCYASEVYGLRATATTARISAEYLHEKPVGILKLDMYYNEVHTVTGQKYMDCLTKVRTAGVTSISNSKNADTGYVFTELNAFAYADGNLVGAKTGYFVQ